MIRHFRRPEKQNETVVSQCGSMCAGAPAPGGWNHISDISPMRLASCLGRKYGAALLETIFFATSSAFLPHLRHGSDLCAFTMSQ